MDVWGPVWSALTAGVISGVLVFSFQQWAQHRIKRIEAELQRLRTYQEGTHERLVTAYAKIWTGLVKLEDWLKRELVAIIGSGDIDPNRWAVIFDTYNGFRGEMLFLPDLFYERTGRLMTTLEQNISSPSRSAGWHGFAGGRAGNGVTGIAGVSWTHQTAQMPPNRPQLTMSEIKLLGARRYAAWRLKQCGLGEIVL
jgi:hypothetical protein